MVCRSQAIASLQHGVSVPAFCVRLIEPSSRRLLLELRIVPKLKLLFRRSFRGPSSQDARPAIGVPSCVFKNRRHPPVFQDARDESVEPISEMALDVHRAFIRAGPS
jgi:hypothetical protein